MKRLVLLAPALLFLAACDGDLTQSSATTAPVRHMESTTVAPPVEPTAVSPYVSPVDLVDEVMQSVAAEEGIHLPDGMGSAYADIVCTGFDDGLSFTLIVRIAATEIPDWTESEHAFLVGASVGSACPEWADTITGGVA